MKGEERECQGSDSQLSEVAALHCVFVCVGLVLNWWRLVGFIPCIECISPVAILEGFYSWRFSFVNENCVCRLETNIVMFGDGPHIQLNWGHAVHR